MARALHAASHEDLDVEDEEEQQQDDEHGDKNENANLFLKRWFGERLKGVEECYSGRRGADRVEKEAEAERSSGAAGGREGEIVSEEKKKQSYCFRCVKEKKKV
uniref:Uncharacterized protein n=1 Tax=Steinernema glaseri TaxID=37863 RepID=A0A1I8AMT9_9BILA